MRISRIKTENYRQLKNLDIEFSKKQHNDLSIFIGRNGHGKTNLLNAINWCFYGLEPHLSKNSKKLPIINLNSIQNSDEEKDEVVKVEVSTETKEKDKFIFSRESRFRIYNGEPKKQETKFKVIAYDENNNPKIYDEEKEYVRRFFPEAIREFFFFDGERLDNYFKEATAQNIRNAVFRISQIDLLEHVEKRLNKLSKEFRREASKNSPEIKIIESNLEKKEKQLNDILVRKKDAIKQAKISKTEVIEYEKKLRKIPDIEKLEDERNALNIEIKNKNNQLNKKIIKKQNILFDYSKIILPWKAIINTIELIDKKKEKGEIPPTINKELIKEIINNNKCSICGNKLDKTSRNKVERLLNNIELSSKIGKELHYLENPLLYYKDKIEGFIEKTKEIEKEINSYEDEIEEANDKIRDIDKQLSGYDLEKIKNWHHERKKWEDIRDEKNKDIGKLETQESNTRKEINELERKLEKELKKEEKANYIKKQRKFCLRSLEAISKVKKEIMNETRKRIETKTKEIFFELIWKQRTFENISIEDDYSISVMHNMGYECLGSLSAAERELLALSFTLSLHDISGFESPILIDTPVARISDDHRMNFGEIFARISNHKQVILLFTPDEYSKNISETLDQKAIHRFEFNLSSDENETTVEVL